VLVLEDLDKIDWALLQHAYGEATDVPGLLRSLLSSDVKEREHAIYELFGNIWHQGSVYSASAAAVPFLYQLLTCPNTQQKPSIAGLLACIAAGTGYLQVHTDIDWREQMWRGILTKKGTSLEAELAREAAEVAQLRRVVSVGLHHLIPFLFDTQSEVRESVAKALGNYPEHVAVSLPALEKALASETDEEVRAAMEESKARLMGGES
jgi:hypothetical protein